MESQSSCPQSRSTGSQALLTDLYELTMAQGLWKTGRHEAESVFHLFFRRAPFGGEFALAAGLAPAADFLQNLRFDASDLDYLAGLAGADERPLFERSFLDYLRPLRFECDVDGLPEGTAVFPYEPLLRVRGPMLQAQIVETAMLNIINFQTLIATKSARVCAAARPQPVLEFGLRRAQGVDGGLAASRAAYLGGCAATSNVLAGKQFGIPVRGTHAHSWVMAFDSELEAFQDYARAMPNNCVFLVDTYDTIQGVRTAIEVAKWLRGQGHSLLGIRLDSGDLRTLSFKARALLDAAGLRETAIIASNELDEDVIRGLKKDGAPIGVWGVGTKLVTADGQPALGGVYKLAAIRGSDGRWSYKLKLSEEPGKVSNPGILQVRRYCRQGSERPLPYADLLYDESIGVPESATLVRISDAQARLPLAGARGTDLLRPVFQGGKFVGERASLAELQSRAVAEWDSFHEATATPPGFVVGLESELHARKVAMIQAGSARH